MLSRRLARPSLTLFATLLAILAAAPGPEALAAGARAARSIVPTLPPAELHAGQRAVVHTVFTGTQVDSFEAEIVGVMEGGKAEGTTIVAKATTPAVIASGVAQGMSGSPVYVNGRLIGALSSGWAFSKEPLFGITPIGEMLDVLDQPARPAGGGVPTSAGPSGPDAPGRITDLAFGPFRWAEPEPAQPGLPPAIADGGASQLAPLALPLTGTLQPAAARLLAPYFQSTGLHLVTGAGGKAKAAPATLVPGGAVAVDVLRGDLQLSAIGTVTYVDGDRVLIFGHPFFQAGDVRMPLSTAVITTIVASQQNSFKLGQPGTEVGVATQDRRTAVGGQLGQFAHLMPITITIESEGRPAQRFHFESIEDRSLAPLLLSAAALNSVLESNGSGASQTIAWSMDLHRTGVAPLHMEDVASGDSPLNDLTTGLMGPVRFLLNNPYERVVLDSVVARVKIAPRRRQWTLRSARLLQASVRPGEDAHVRCEIESWRGERKEVELALHAAEELPDGAYVLYLGGGTELTRYEAAHLPARFRPTSLDDAWRRFGSLPQGAALYGALFASAPEVTRRGQDYPELPLSALALMSSGTAAGEVARRGDAALIDERHLPLDGPLRGEVLLPLRVDRTAP